MSDGFNAALFLSLCELDNPDVVPLILEGLKPKISGFIVTCKSFSSSTIFDEFSGCKGRLSDLYGEEKALCSCVGEVVQLVRAVLSRCTLPLFYIKIGVFFDLPDHPVAFLNLIFLRQEDGQFPRFVRDLLDGVELDKSMETNLVVEAIYPLLKGDCKAFLLVEEPLDATFKTPQDLLEIFSGPNRKILKNECRRTKGIQISDCVDVSSFSEILPLLQPLDSWSPVHALPVATRELPGNHHVSLIDRAKNLLKDLSPPQERPFLSDFEHRKTAELILFPKGEEGEDQRRINERDARKTSLSPPKELQHIHTDFQDKTGNQREEGLVERDVKRERRVW